jgi:HSP20 family molecular chaperone IbpA
MKSVIPKIAIGLACFILGIGSVLFFQKFEIRPKHSESTPPGLHAMRDVNSMFDQFYGNDFFGNSRDPFESMRKMREQMMKEFDQPEEGSGIFDSWYKHKFGGGDAGEIKKREDTDFIYYDIAVKDVGKDKLNVRVANGQIEISGQIEKRSDDNGQGTYFSSSFHRSFPLPPDVDGNKVQMEQNKDLLTLKFPKTSGHA